MTHIRTIVLSTVFLCLTSAGALAEKSCDELFADIPKSYIESVNNHLEVRTVAWLKFGAQVDRGVAAIYELSFPDLDVKYPVTTLVCAHLESARYDSPGLSFNVKAPIDDIRTTGFKKSEGEPDGHTYMRCVNIDECTISIQRLN